MATADCLVLQDAQAYVLASFVFAAFGASTNVVTIFLIVWTRAYRQHVHRLTLYLAILGLCSNGHRSDPRGHRRWLKLESCVAKERTAVAKRMRGHRVRRRTPGLLEVSSHAQRLLLHICASRLRREAQPDRSGDYGSRLSPLPPDFAVMDTIPQRLVRFDGGVVLDKRRLLR